MRTVIIAMMLIIASQAWAECGNLCDWGWWATATEADVQAELDGWCRRHGHGMRVANTPLHWAARRRSTPATVQALLAAGADLMARNKDGTDTAALWLLGVRHPCKYVQALLAAGADVMARD